MAIRLLDWDKSNLAQCIVEKSLLWIWFLSLICLIYMFRYIFKLKRCSEMVKLGIIYILWISECIIVVVHYSVMNHGNKYLNSFAIMQEMVKFVYYFYVLLILFRSSLRAIRNLVLPNFMVVMLVLYGVNATYIIVVLVLAFFKSVQTNEERFWADIVWLLIRIGHLLSIILLIILAMMLRDNVTKIIKNNNISWGEGFKNDLFKLNVVIGVNFWEAIIHFCIDFI